MFKLNIKVLIVALIGLVCAFLLGGYTLPKILQMKSQAVASLASNIELPKDLVKISGCIPFEGEHWVSPKDVKHGPYYVIYNGKLMAIEYMFTEADIAGAKYAKMSPFELIKYMQTNKLEFSDLVNDIRSFNFPTFGANIKYFDIHWTGPHAGVVVPHFDMHMYLVEKSEMDTVCPKATLQDAASESLIQDLIQKGIPLPKAQ